MRFTQTVLAIKLLNRKSVFIWMCLIYRRDFKILCDFKQTIGLKNQHLSHPQYGVFPSFLVCETMDLRNEYGTIRSPNYPDYYPSGVTCQWNVILELQKVDKLFSFKCITPYSILRACFTED